MFVIPFYNAGKDVGAEVGGASDIKRASPDSGGRGKVCINPLLDFSNFQAGFYVEFARRGESNRVNAAVKKRYAVKLCLDFFDSGAQSRLRDIEFCGRL